MNGTDNATAVSQQMNAPAAAATEAKPSPLVEAMKTLVEQIIQESTISKLLRDEMEEIAADTANSLIADIAADDVGATTEEDVQNIIEGTMQDADYITTSDAETMADELVEERMRDTVTEDQVTDMIDDAIDDLDIPDDDHITEVVEGYMEDHGHIDESQDENIQALVEAKVAAHMGKAMSVENIAVQLACNPSFTDTVAYIVAEKLAAKLLAVLKG